LIFSGVRRCGTIRWEAAIVTAPKPRPTATNSSTGRYSSMSSADLRIKGLDRDQSLEHRKLSATLMTVNRGPRASGDRVGAPAEVGAQPLRRLTYGRFKNATRGVERTLVELLDRLGQRRHDLEQVAHDAVVGNLEDGRIGVLVDGHDAP